MNKTIFPENAHNFWCVYSNKSFIPTPSLPREKPVPKEKALTKWEQFARDKGLTKKKKDKKVWDHILKVGADGQCQGGAILWLVETG